LEYPEVYNILCSFQLSPCSFIMEEVYFGITVLTFIIVRINLYGFSYTPVAALIKYSR
jgi:hypothetical protein